MREATSTGQASSQLIFHSLVGQLIMTCPHTVTHLESTVAGALRTLSGTATPSEVAARLYSAAVKDGHGGFVPEISHVSWDLPGVRVTSHSANVYVVSRLGNSHPEGLKTWEVPHDASFDPKRSISPAQKAAPPGTTVVCESMWGRIVFSSAHPLSEVTALVLNAVSDDRLRIKLSRLAGSIFQSLGEATAEVNNLRVDLTLNEATPDTLWLRHLSGETYAYFVGSRPEPESWSMVGRGFLGEKVGRRLIRSA